MKDFTSLYHSLDGTTSSHLKMQALAEYFSKASAPDRTWAVALLTGRRPKRPIRTNDLRRWASELSGIPLWLFEECYSVVGDLAETVSLLIARPQPSVLKPLHIIMEEIIQIITQTDEQKKEWLNAYWKSMSREELFVFSKLITGSFRVGVSQQLVYKALAKTYAMDEREVAHRLMGDWKPSSTTLEDLINAESGSDHVKPYPFYLAYQLECRPGDLGEVHEWQIERKYDGIRGQVILRKGEVNIWSRGEELMNDKFPEFMSLYERLPAGTVIDGEILPFKEGRILNFSEMQKRLGRKTVSKKLLGDIPLCIMSFDLLEYEGKDIRHESLKTRRKLLEQLVDTASVPQLLLSPVLEAEQWQDVFAYRDESRSLGCEGLMLKKRDGVYETGRRKGGWWKWKVDPYTVDAVLIYAQAGHGRRANLYTDYTFAVWDQDKLVPFAKAYSGLTDKEIVQVDNWIKKNTLEKFGPVRSVKPELVFELAFEGISLSLRHKSGIALRFPRIQRWRQDKKAGEANTRSDLLQLLKAQ